jgi:hypothetical protein
MALSNGGLVVCLLYFGSDLHVSQGCARIQGLYAYSPWECRSSQCAFKGIVKARPTFCPTDRMVYPYPACSLAATIRACAPLYPGRSSTVQRPAECEIVIKARGNNALGDMSLVVGSLGHLVPVRLLRTRRRSNFIFHGWRKDIVLGRDRIVVPGKISPGMKASPVINGGGRTSSSMMDRRLEQ